MSKFVLLGLDGATFEMLGPMVDTGRLPVLQRLVEQGASGTLTSTVPPYTCPAWPTMFTGRNPGAHGVTSFHLLEPDTVESRAATLRDVAAPRLWQTLNSAGVRTGIFNVPMTYPAEPVDGFMVSGFVAPPGAPHAVQPQPLAEAFAEAFPDYDVNGPELGGRIYTRVEDYRALMHALRDTLEQRQAALEWLLEREPVDFLYVVLETLDRISHPAYGFLAPGAPTYESPLGAAVREEVLKVLEVQDRVMGRILELMGPDPAVMIVSDHGFCHPRKHFDLRSCLLDHGLMAAGGRLSFRGRLKPLARSLVTRTLGFGAWKRMSRFLRHTLGVQSEQRPGSERWSAARKSTWDWSRSKTWFGPQMEYGIRVNTAGRMPESPVAPEAREAVVSEVVDALAAARDPEDERPVFDLVKRREELYQGDYVERAPDVLFVPHRAFIHSTIPFEEARPEAGYLAPMPRDAPSGQHDMNGVLVAAGGAFGSGSVEGAGILDVMPTLLYAMDQPVPADLEGRVVTEAFAQETLSARPVKRSSGETEITAPDQEAAAYSAEDEDAIRRRLEELGYM